VKKKNISNSILNQNENILNIKFYDVNKYARQTISNSILNQNENILNIKFYDVNKYARQTISRVLSFKLIICLGLRSLLSSSN